MDKITKAKNGAKQPKLSLNELEVLVQYSVFKDEFNEFKEQITKGERDITNDEMNALLAKFCVESMNYAPVPYAASPDMNKFVALLRLINETYYGINSPEYFSIGVINDSPSKVGFNACYGQNQIILTSKSFSFGEDTCKDFVNLLIYFSHEMSHYADDVRNNYSRRKANEVNYDGRFSNDTRINEILTDVIDDFVSYSFYFMSKDEKQARDNSIQFAQFYVNTLLTNLEQVYDEYSAKEKNMLDFLAEYLNQMKRYIKECKIAEENRYLDCKGYQNQSLEKTGIAIKDFQQKIISTYEANLGLTKNTINDFEEDIVDLIATIDYNDNSKLYDNVKNILEQYRKQIGEIEYYYLKNMLLNNGNYAFSKDELIESIKFSISSNPNCCFASVLAKYFYIDRKLLINCMFECTDIEMLKKMYEREVEKHLVASDKKMIDDKFAKMERENVDSKLLKKIMKLKVTPEEKEKRVQYDKLVKYISNAEDSQTVTEKNKSENNI